MKFSEASCNCRSVLYKVTDSTISKEPWILMLGAVDTDAPLPRCPRRAGKKDVLVATDVASKGLDFTAIAHVINYDMPGEIENYVHRIGRTGRSGKTGLATTMVNTRRDQESILLDLKHLLKEAKQHVPEFLLVSWEGRRAWMYIWNLKKGGDYEGCGVDAAMHC